ncbi:1701_t:CDS:1 [Dentiscutata erythropus]|uniref:1701_t:CDS:1 n=1 Tax=Dentiscutata erythropus TaxID=1348616 RepID=A0A9N9IYD6_9GLOM|nr:1701_t:CDS:1 [Dentiscutata erythropus]
MDTPRSRTKKSPSERLSDLKRRLSILPEPYDTGNGWSKYDKEIQDQDNQYLSPNCVIVKTEILVSTQQISNSEDISNVELSTEGAVTTIVPEHHVSSAISNKRNSAIISTAISNKRNSAIINTEENKSYKRRSKLEFFKQDYKRNSAILNTEEHYSHKRKSKLDFFKQNVSLTKFQSAIKQFVDTVGNQSRRYSKTFSRNRKENPCD